MLASLLSCFKATFLSLHDFNWAVPQGVCSLFWSKTGSLLVLCTCSVPLCQSCCRNLAAMGPLFRSCQPQTQMIGIIDLLLLKDHPRTPTHVCSRDFLSLSLVNLLRSCPVFLFMGIISNMMGLKNTKAKFRCVKPSKLKSSGDTELHFLILAQDSQYPMLILSTLPPSLLHDSRLKCSQPPKFF